MITAIQDNMLRKRTDGEKPTGPQDCSECGRVVHDHEDRMMCNVEGCPRLMCIPCFDLSPVCFLCHRHICEEHLVAMADLGICTECARSGSIMAREVQRVKADIDAEIVRHSMAVQRLADRYNRAAAIAAERNGA